MAFQTTFKRYELKYILTLVQKAKVLDAMRPYMNLDKYGRSSMAQSFSYSEQGVIAVSVGNQSAGTSIVLKDAKGNMILSHEPELSFAVVIISTPELVKGKTYSVTVGAVTEEFEAN